MSFKGYGWYLSSTAALLYLSWIVHNLIAWIKIKPFISTRSSQVFTGTLCLTIAPIIFQIVNNFLFFSNIRDTYIKVRPFEVLMRLGQLLRCRPCTDSFFRDPWWIYGCIVFFYFLKTQYTVSIGDLINGHPRFAIMLSAMVFSIVFTIVDIAASAVPRFSPANG